LLGATAGAWVWAVALHCGLWFLLDLCLLRSFHARSSETPGVARQAVLWAAGELARYVLWANSYSSSLINWRGQHFTLDNAGRAVQHTGKGKGKGKGK